MSLTHSQSGTGRTWKNKGNCNVLSILNLSSTHSQRYFMLVLCKALLTNSSTSEYICNIFQFFSSTGRSIITSSNCPEKVMLYSWSSHIHPEPLRSENNISISCTSTSPLSSSQHVSTRLLLNRKSKTFIPTLIEVNLIFECTFFLNCQLLALSAHHFRAQNLDLFVMAKIFDTFTIGALWWIRLD